jgi:hypothetical protein
VGSDVTNPSKLNCILEAVGNEAQNIPIVINHDITITILDIILYTVFYLKHSISDVEICLRLQVEPKYLGTRIGLVSVSGVTSA